MYSSRMVKGGCVFTWDMEHGTKCLPFQYGSAFYGQVTCMVGTNDFLSHEQYTYHLKCMEAFERCLKLQRN